MNRAPGSAGINPLLAPDGSTVTSPDPLRIRLPPANKSRHPCFLEARCSEGETAPTGRQVLITRRSMALATAPARESTPSLT